MSNKANHQSLETIKEGEFYSPSEKIARIGLKILLLAGLIAILGVPSAIFFLSL